MRMKMAERMSRTRALYLLVGAVAGLCLVYDVVPVPLNRMYYTGSSSERQNIENKSSETHSTLQQHIMDKKLSNSDSLSNKTDHFRLRQDQRMRIQHLQDCCNRFDPFTVKIKRAEQHFYFSPKYNVSYCKVLKIGSSFFTQMFTVLLKGTSLAKNIFKLERDKIHTNLRLLNEVTYTSEERRHSRSILVSRDPYTRLFSAFIDKFYLPLFYFRANEAVKRQRNVPANVSVCPSDVTFQEFLDDVVYCSQNDIQINSHWAPVTSRCNLCNIDVLTIVKQETFADDVEYTLKEIGTGDEEFDLLHHALHDKRTNVTVPGLIKTVMHMAYDVKYKYGKLYCLSEIAVVKRLWNSLQIQGYLRNDVKIPYDVINTVQKAIDVTLIEEVVMAAIRENPMTSEEKQGQRRQAVERAYRDIKMDTIKNIQEVYRYDFMFFNYSVEPPTIMRRQE